MEWFKSKKSYWLALDIKLFEDLDLSIKGKSFQVANYGIGGHYEPHLDFAREGDEEVHMNRGLGKDQSQLNYKSIFKSTYINHWDFGVARL